MPDILFSFRDKLKLLSKNKHFDDILILFGKFYFYSFVYILLFALLYPLLLISNISTISLVLSFIILRKLFHKASKSINIPPYYINILS